MATIYINPSGDNSRTYTQAQDPSTPWQTIAKCNTSGTTGDTIICQDGTYPWVSQTFTKEFTIQADNEGLAIFDASGAARQWALSLTSHTMITDGLVFQNAIPNAFAAPIFTYGLGSGTVLWDHRNTRFLDIDVSSSITGVAGGLWGDSQGVTHAFKLYLSKCDVSGIEEDVNFATTQGSLIAYDAAAGAEIRILETTINLDGTGTAALANIIDNRANSASTLTIRNSIIRCETSTIFNGGTAFTTTSITYTDLYQTTSNPTLGTGCITSDPLFIDGANHNLNLKPTSPCLNTGSLI